MHILIFHQYYLEQGQGGGSRFNQLAKYWSDMGHSVTVITGMVHYTTGKKPDKWKNKYVAEEMDGKVHVIRTHVSEQYNKSFVGRLWGYFSFVFSAIFGMGKVRKSPDVIVATSPPLFIALPAVAAKLRFRKPLVFEVRDLWPESAIETGVLKNKWMIRLSYWLEGFAYKRANRINVLTPAFEKTLVKKGIPKQKIWMIPNGADLDIFQDDVLVNQQQELKQEFGWEGRFVVLYIGAHGVANHLEQIVTAAERLREHVPEVLFVLIGDGMEKNKLLAMAEEKGLENVSFLPSQPKDSIKRYLYAADVGTAVLKKVDIFKTVYPNKVFDYMTCRKPIILGIDGVARELVADHADCGIYVEPEDVDAMVEAVKYYHNNLNTRMEHGNNGYKYVVEHFDRKKLAEAYAEKMVQLL